MRRTCDRGRRDEVAVQELEEALDGHENTEYALLVHRWDAGLALIWIFARVLAGVVILAW